MNAFLDPKNLKWYVIYTLIWGSYMSWKTQFGFLYYFVLDLFCVYLIALTYKYYCMNKEHIKSESKILSMSFIILVVYTVATVVKYINHPIFLANGDKRPYIGFLFQTLNCVGGLFCLGLVIILRDIENFRIINKTVIKFLPLIIFLFYIPFTYIYIPVSVLFFYICYAFCLPRKCYWYVPVAIIMVMFIQGQRITLLMIIVAFIGMFIFKMGWFKSKAFSNVVNFFLLSLPIVLFILGATDVFNIFQIGEYFGSEEMYGDEDITSDTRTFLFREAILSSIQDNDVLFGRLIGFGYQSVHFAQVYDVNTETFDRNAEIFVINIFTWMGMLGLILFFLLFVQASYKAINGSDSQYMRYTGLLLSIYWNFCWLEIPCTFTHYTLITLYMLMAMCYSPYWRSLTDEDFKYELKSIFDS